MNKVENPKNLVMKKILIILLIAVGALTSCYDEFRTDYDHTAVAFSTASGGSDNSGVLSRTVVKDEGLDLDIGVYLGGVLENDKERWVEYELDPSLLSGTSYELMPEDYYTLSNEERFIIPSGSHIGRVNVMLDSAQFVDDPNAVNAHYAIPFRLTGTSADSILENQSTKILVVKYINHYEGYYQHKGTYTTFNSNGEQISSGKIDNVLTVNTMFLDTVRTNGMINQTGEDFNLKMHPNSDQSVYLEYIPNPNPPAPKNIATSATDVSTDYVSPWESLAAINDGAEPANSGDRSEGIYGNWYSHGEWRYVQYGWDKPYILSKSEIYWFSDGGGIQAPDDAYIEYWDMDAEEWKEMPNSTGVGLTLDQYNVTTFDEVVTNQIRMNMHGEASTGIIEWKVWGMLAPIEPEQAPILQVNGLDNNTYNEETNTFNCQYRVDYENGNYTEVEAEMVWRNRVRDGINEWRDH